MPSRRKSPKSKTSSTLSKIKKALNIDYKTEKKKHDYNKVVKAATKHNSKTIERLNKMLLKKTKKLEKYRREKERNEESSESSSYSDSSDGSDDTEIAIMMHQLQLDNNINNQNNVGSVLDQLQHLNSDNPANMTTVLQQLQNLNPSNSTINQQAANYYPSGVRSIDLRRTDVLDPYTDHYTEPRYDARYDDPYYSDHRHIDSRHTDPRFTRSTTYRTQPLRSTGRNSPKEVRISFSIKRSYSNTSSLSMFTSSQITQILNYINSFYTFLKRKQLVHNVLDKADVVNNSIKLVVDMDATHKVHIKPFFQEFARSNRFPFRDYVADVSSVS
jgi:hypothetical protein